MIIREWWPERDGQVWLRVRVGYWRALGRWPVPGRLFQWDGYLPRLWYFVKCALWHRYDRLSIPTLSPTWNEWDEQLLHAALAVFCDYYECESPGRWTLAQVQKELADASTDEHSRVWLEGYLPTVKEMDAIYRWWTIDRPRRPDPTQSVFVAEGQTTEAALKSHEMEESQHAEDEAMLIRLMKIRRDLWT